MRDGTTGWQRPGSVPARFSRPARPSLLGAHRPRMLRICARFADLWNSGGTVGEMAGRKPDLGRGVSQDREGSHRDHPFGARRGLQHGLPGSARCLVERRRFLRSCGEVRRSGGEHVHSRPAPSRPVPHGRADSVAGNRTESLGGTARCSGGHRRGRRTPVYVGDDIGRGRVIGLPGPCRRVPLG